MALNECPKCIRPEATGNPESDVVTAGERVTVLNEEGVMQFWHSMCWDTYVAEKSSEPTP